MWWSIPTAFIFLAPATSAERRLPTDVQVDLLFPRNETYAPAPWFPIIFAIRNLDAAWPLDVDLQVDVFSVGSRRNQTQHVSWQDIGLYSVPTPERHYFHMPAINMIEGATDRYNIVWRLRIWNRCFGGDDDDDDDTNTTEARSWTNDPAPFRMQNLSFSTAPGAMLPDVETSIASCPEPSERSSAAVRILKVRESSADGGRPCPVMEDIPPEKCIYRPLAKQLAGSVKTILDQKLCAADARQTTSAPCQRLSVGASPVVTSWSWMGWALVALASAAWV
ncbi:hypothetical protein MGG_03043 [Pyricularia oryzae 70-15]|uniref:DUF7136 domain-containing protein n=3 Tax=Pyricularia oryzae TaxID=318829 RepID=G4NKR8_PYRO7|nr:uncharacterized protein MGG_03043 [Pyricularia oryzae 70-15]EHA45896.1 hypothetical protein MGG_03043 [Pyricularia oryzae 70-15]ELQ42982.1 hypothetical protein OOU_Y34scaffold00178g2 [Pyricularia oryzae Y34]KAI7913309.1 hypothetical protein M0657_010081 [Pyricularia oryzae]